MDLIPKKQNSDKQAGFWSGLKDFLHGGDKERLDANNFNKEREALKDYQAVTAREKMVIRKNDGVLKRNEVPKNFADVPVGKPQDDISADEKKSIEVRSKVAESIKSWEAPKILKTNLVQGEMTTFVDWHGNLKILLYSCLSAVCLIGVVYIGLIIWEINKEKEGQSLAAEINMLKMSVVKSAADVKEIDVFQEKLKTAESLLASHIYWTNFFKFLENDLLKNVFINGDFSGQPDGGYEFMGSTDNFKVLGSQLKYLESQKEVESVSVDGGKYSSYQNDSGETKNMLNFTMELKVDPKIFFK
jgi:hypothetical protein